MLKPPFCLNNTQFARTAVLFFVGCCARSGIWGCFYPCVEKMRNRSLKPGQTHKWYNDPCVRTLHAAYLCKLPVELTRWTHAAKSECTQESQCSASRFTKLWRTTPYTMNSTWFNQSRAVRPKSYRFTKIQFILVKTCQICRNGLKTMNFVRNATKLYISVIFVQIRIFWKKWFFFPLIPDFFRSFWDFFRSFWDLFR